MIFFLYPITINAVGERHSHRRHSTGRESAEHSDYEEAAVLIGIIYSTEKKVIEKLARGLKRGLEEQGHRVQVYTDNDERFSGLAGCRHLFVGSFSTGGFKPKTPMRLKEMLSKTGGISGKRSIAFLAKGGMGERKALAALMNDMEKQGCYIIDQEIFSSEQHAYNFGKSVHLKE